MLDVSAIGDDVPCRRSARGSPQVVWPAASPDAPRVDLVRVALRFDADRSEYCQALRRSFGRRGPIQRCLIYKARNIMERLSPGVHASVRCALRHAWELNDAGKAERLIGNLAQRLERDGPASPRASCRGWMRSSR